MKIRLMSTCDHEFIIPIGDGSYGQCKQCGDSTFPMRGRVFVYVVHSEGNIDSVHETKASAARRCFELASAWGGFESSSDWRFSKREMFS